jgi:uncharacterized protein YbjQ (UPF0145 family)
MAKLNLGRYIHVVSVDTIPGHEVREVKGLVWGTTVRAKFVGKDILAVLRAMVGGEVVEYTQMINEARRKAIEKMVDNARALGANAVIGTHIGSTSQIMPGTAEIFAYGTAVVTEPKAVERAKRRK